MKNSILKKLILVLGIVATCLLPFIGTGFKVPNGFGAFPSVQITEPPRPATSIIYFLIVLSISILFGLFYLFPKWFGFKEVGKVVKKRYYLYWTLPVLVVLRHFVPGESLKMLCYLMMITFWIVFLLHFLIGFDNEKEAKGKYPIWFWPSLFIWILYWISSFAQIEELELFNVFAFNPLWWSFILFLDGIVYKRTLGNSLVAKRPWIFVISIVFSAVGWYYYEYLDYFLLSNWYYPNGQMLITKYGFSKILNWTWFAVAFATVWPAIFEWYCLLDSIEFFSKRFTEGPKLDPGKKGKLLSFVVMLLGIIICIAMARFPFLLFFGLWTAPLFLFSGLLPLLGYWTVFTPIKKGNYRPMALIALASLFNGFMWEFWNFGSEHASEIAINPNFWIYDVPYVNIIHIFSEMPLVGFMGYLPFGIICWIVWIVGANICGFDPDFRVLNKNE